MKTIIHYVKAFAACSLLFVFSCFRGPEAKAQPVIVEDLSNLATNICTSLNIADDVARNYFSWMEKSESIRKAFEALSDISKASSAARHIILCGDMIVDYTDNLYELTDYLINNNKTGYAVGAALSLPDLFFREASDSLKETEGEIEEEKNLAASEGSNASSRELLTRVTSLAENAETNISLIYLRYVSAYYQLLSLDNSLSEVSSDNAFRSNRYY